MSNYGYGGGQNPFDDRGDADRGGYGGYNQGGYNQGGYNQGGYNQGGYGQQSYGGGNTYDQGGSMEMSGGGSIAFLNECRNIDNEIARMEDENLRILRQLHERASHEADQSPESKTNQDITELLGETTNLYRNLSERLRTLGSNPESQSPKCKPQFERVKRSLKVSMDKFYEVRMLNNDRENLKRQFKIVYGVDPSESQINEMANSGQGSQLFTQALMQSNRTGQANKSLQALRARANALEAIEKQMEELVELFEQMNELVVQQDVAVAQIEQKAEETVEHLDKGNEEIGVAVETARKTRKKKWICLGIVVLIIIIVAGAVGGYLATQNRGNNNSNSKRSLLSDQLRGGPARLVDRERLVPRVVGEANIKKWVEKTQRRGVVPTGMSTDDVDLNGDAFDLVKRVPATR